MNNQIHNVMEPLNDPLLEPPTYPVGKRLFHDGITVEVTEHMGCDGCLFFRARWHPCCTRNYRYGNLARHGMSFNVACAFGRCSPELRTDHKDIIFKLIKDKESNGRESRKVSDS